MENVIYVGPSNLRIGLTHMQQFKKTSQAIDDWVARFPPAKGLFCPFRDWRFHIESSSVKIITQDLLAKDAFRQEGAVTEQAPASAVVVFSTVTRADFPANPTTSCIVDNVVGFEVDDTVVIKGGRNWKITGINAEEQKLDLQWLSGPPANGTITASGSTVSKIRV
jgi:hypothetical protein